MNSWANLHGKVFPLPPNSPTEAESRISVSVEKSGKSASDFEFATGSALANRIPASARRRQNSGDSLPCNCKASIKDSRLIRNASSQLGFTITATLHVFFGNLSIQS